MKKGFTPYNNKEMLSKFLTILKRFRMRRLCNLCCDTGFTLIELLIGAAIFAIFVVSIYSAYSNVLDITNKIRLNAAGINLIRNEIEMIRNLPYEDVGIQGAYPIGKLLAEKPVFFNNIAFVLKTTVRNVDDPFDGTIGGTPNDTAPADYKLVELEINSPEHPGFSPVKLTTTIAPRHLETTTNNGALFINVFDAFGQPVSGANVSVINNTLSPPIQINDTTNINGILQLVDIPTSTLAYKIKVSKNGYSSDQTYPLGAPENPNPLKPHATVSQQQVTAISFAIDRVSNIYLKTVNQMCQAIPNISFSQNGTKLIGQAPDVLKYSASSATNLNGEKTISNLEWDTYNFFNLDENYDLSGSQPLWPLILNPNSNIGMIWTMELKNPLALLVTVQDTNNQPVANVSVRLTKTGFDKVLYTGRRFFSQTDWSNGQYSAQSGGIEDNNPTGEVKLMLTEGKYPTSTEAWLISSTFDLGTSSTTFYNLSWQPENQPTETGPESFKLQIAANNDNSTWDFIGPDGTSYNNNRYLRYKVFLKTQNENFTPKLEEIKFEFSSSCIPSGQVFFNGLVNGTYALSVQKSGYQTASATVSISENWQEYKVTLISE